MSALFQSTWWRAGQTLHIAGPFGEIRLVRVSVDRVRAVDNVLATALVRRAVGLTPARGSAWYGLPAFFGHAPRCDPASVACRGVDVQRDGIVSDDGDAS